LSNEAFRQEIKKAEFTTGHLLGAGDAYLQHPADSHISHPCSFPQDGAGMGQDPADTHCSRCMCFLTSISRKKYCPHNSTFTTLVALALSVGGKQPGY